MIVSTKILNFGRPGRLKTGNGDFLVDSKGNHLAIFGPGLGIASLSRPDTIGISGGGRLVDNNGNSFLILGQNINPLFAAIQEAGMPLLWRRATGSDKASYGSGKFNLNSNLISPEGNTNDIYIEDGKLKFNRGTYIVMATVKVEVADNLPEYKAVAVEPESGIPGLSWLQDWTVPDGFEERTLAYVLDVFDNGSLLELSLGGPSDAEADVYLTRVDCCKVADV